jgi:outer membrane immunogenic protein
MTGLEMLSGVSESLFVLPSSLRFGCASRRGNWRYGLALTGIVLTFSGSVQAADLDAKLFRKAPAAQAAVSSWTGFYAGLGLGFRTTEDDLTTTSHLQTGPPVDLTGAALTQPFNGTGFRANPYAGYNWQVAPRWVVGVEADVGFGDRTTTLQGFTSPAFGFSGDPADSLSVKTTWDASLRGRIGYLVTPSTLLYATGGAAWQHDKVTSNCLGFGCSVSAATPAVVTNSTIRAGWTVGGGIETVLWGSWLARAEYRYADYGTAPMTMSRGFFAEGVAVQVDDRFDARLRSHLASFGLAYKFGEPVDGGARSFEAFEPRATMTSWSGVYAGLGLGARATRTDVDVASESVNGAVQELTDLATSRPFDGIGFRANPYVGYNWQVVPRWVAGLEADAGFADQKTTRAGFVSFTLPSGEQGESMAVRTNWDASLRGRVGFLATPATLLYATGGVAWQHYQLNSTCVSEFCAIERMAPAIVNQSATKMGGTVGGGIETALSAHWLARAEYRYADFGHSSFTVARTSPFLDFNSTVDVFDVALRTHTVNFGLAYKFD